MSGDENMALFPFGASGHVGPGPAAHTASEPSKPPSPPSEPQRELDAIAPASDQFLTAAQVAAGIAGVIDHTEGTIPTRCVTIVQIVRMCDGFCGSYPDVRMLRSYTLARPVICVT